MGGAGNRGSLERVASRNSAYSVLARDYRGRQLKVRPTNRQLCRQRVERMKLSTSSSAVGLQRHLHYKLYFSLLRERTITGTLSVSRLKHRKLRRGYPWYGDTLDRAHTTIQTPVKTVSCIFSHLLTLYNFCMQRNFSSEWEMCILPAQFCKKVAAQHAFIRSDKTFAFSRPGNSLRKLVGE